MLNETLVRAVRLPGPHVPGWFPLVAERVHRLFGPKSGVMTVRVLDSGMTLDVGEYMQRRFYYNCYEAPEVRFFRRWLRGGDIVVDVGAHVGLFTLLASRLVGADGAVHAFEPVPGNFERLRANVALNRLTNVRFNRFAVGNEIGEVSLGLHDERLLGESTCDYTVGGEIGTVTAPLTTLDAYLQQAESRRLRLVKIDVEGFEPHVLEGLAGTLSEASPDAIMLEVNAKMLFAHGSSPTAVLDLLTEHGYRVYRLGLRGRLRPAPAAGDLEAAASRWDFDHEPSSRLRVGLGTRETLFNAIAINTSASRR